MERLSMPMIIIIIIVKCEMAVSLKANYRFKLKHYFFRYIKNKKKFIQNHKVPDT